MVPSMVRVVLVQVTAQRAHRSLVRLTCLVTRAVLGLRLRLVRRFVAHVCVIVGFAVTFVASVGLKTLVVRLVMILLMVVFRWERAG